MEQRDIIRDELAEIQHPEMRRHPNLKPGQWRFDPEFGRKNNPAVFAQEHGYPQLTGRVRRRDR